MYRSPGLKRILAAARNRACDLTWNLDDVTFAQSIELALAEVIVVVSYMRALIDLVLSPDECLQLIFIHKALAVRGYRDAVTSATLFDIAVAEPSLLLPLVNRFLDLPFNGPCTASSPSQTTQAMRRSPLETKSTTLSRPHSASIL